jgi:hypothetical protein
MQSSRWTLTLLETPPGEKCVLTSTQPHIGREECREFDPVEYSSTSILDLFICTGLILGRAPLPLPVNQNIFIIMADLSTCPPINRSSVQTAHKRIEKYIHRTPTVTCETLNQIASTPKSERCPSTGANVAAEPAPHTNSVQGTAATSNANPEVRLFFKCENQQRIGAFKARGAFHALGRLIEEKGIETVREKGVVTHSSGMVSSSLVNLLARLTKICRKPCTSSGFGCQNTRRARTHCNADHLYALENRRHKIAWCQCHLLRVY